MNEAARRFRKMYQHSKTSMIRVSTDLKLLRAGAKICCGPIVVLLVIAALGPGKWAPRTALGWQIDHFVGYFGITLFFCFAWSRPFVVGAAFAAVAALLEGLQAFTPDRSAYVPAIFYGAAGALVAALMAELFMRVWRLGARRTAAAFKRFLTRRAGQESTLSGIPG